MWKSKKKISPKCRDPPTAMIDEDGNIASSEKTVEKIAIKTYKKRLENRKIKENLKELKDSKEELCKLRLKAAGGIKHKTGQWSNLIKY